MSIQLSLYWQAADKIDWYWSADTDVYSGTLEELQEQKQEKNVDICITRLFLPASWFSTLELKLPVNARRVNASILKFAAEEFLAQDIDTVHLVPNQQNSNGSTTVQVTDLDRFSQILKTLSARNFVVTDAFNAQLFSISDSHTEDVLLQISNEAVSVCANDRVFNVHPKGFSQWFELWLSQQNLDDEPNLKIISETADGVAKPIVTELEASGARVQWVVQSASKLIDWHEKAENNKVLGNLITGEFSPGSGDKHFNLWVPACVAALCGLVIWGTLSFLEIKNLNAQTAATWEASENVFLQVFGKSKRIQRPWMVRELRTLISQNQGSAEIEINALTVLADISEAAPSLILEDFRYNQDRLESFFTLVQLETGTGDAYNLFETLKTRLIEKGYESEYSANQDNDAFRARFKVVYGGLN
jgi:type II secretory pathway component PulL